MVTFGNVGIKRCKQNASKAHHKKILKAVYELLLIITIKEHSKYY